MCLCCGHTYFLDVKFSTDDMLNAFAVVLIVL